MTTVVKLQSIRHRCPPVGVLLILFLPWLVGCHASIIPFYLFLGTNVTFVCVMRTSFVQPHGVSLFLPASFSLLDMFLCLFLLPLSLFLSLSHTLCLSHILSGHLSRRLCVTPQVAQTAVCERPPHLGCFRTQPWCVTTNAGRIVWRNKSKIEHMLLRIVVCQHLHCCKCGELT